jgi:putative endonuclease
MPSTQQTGRRGEQAAAAYLRGKGYQIIATNWRCKQGELDIIAYHDKILVFIEVRARATVEDAFASITPAKRQKLISAIYAYLNQNGLEECLWQVDVIAAVRGTIEHLENALDW